MRLICPNCGAQYEVADDVVPEAGRDVQCSNCGHTWFERPGASEAAEEELIVPQDVVEVDAAPEPDLAPEPEPEPVPEQDPQPATAPESAPPSAAAPHPVPASDPEDAPEPASSISAPDAASEPDQSPNMPADDDAEPAEQDDAPTLDPAPQSDKTLPPRPPLDASIAEILREEAAREEANRAAEAQSGLEQQDDLGLQQASSAPPSQGPSETEQRISRLRGEDQDSGIAAAVAATVANSRRELLPDIEEINSTLRSDSERDAPPPLPEEIIAEEKRGFRFGFFGVLMIFIVLLVIYLAANQIATWLPALESALTAYVAAVDALRLWIDLMIQKLLALVEGGGGGEG